jgi:hypothetical protein
MHDHVEFVRPPRSTERALTAPFRCCKSFSDAGVHDDVNVSGMCAVCQKLSHKPRFGLGRTEAVAIAS